MDILLIGGSPRKNGNSDIIIEKVRSEAERSGKTTETIQLRDLTVTPCIGCERCRKDKACTAFTDDMTPLYEKILQAHSLFMISPVHNYNITAWMKSFIDRLYCFYEFEEPRPNKWSSRLAGQNRKAIVAAVSEQKEKREMGFTIEAMQMPLEALGYKVESLRFLGVFKRGAVTASEEYMTAAAKAGRKLAAY